MDALIQRLSKLRLKFSREIQNGMSSLRGMRGFSRRNQRHAGMVPLRGHGGEADYDERRLSDQLMLKDYGKIEAELKNEGFESIKVPQHNEEAQVSAVEQTKETAKNINQ